MHCSKATVSFARHPDNSDTVSPVLPWTDEPALKYWACQSTLDWRHLMQRQDLQSADVGIEVQVFHLFDCRNLFTECYNLLILICQDNSLDCY